MPDELFVIEPDENHMGNYGNRTIEATIAKIVGKYDVLNLAGALVPYGTIIAENGSEANTVILSGARVRDAIDLTYMPCGRFYGQAIFSGDVLLGRVRELVDVSASKINGELFLEYTSNGVDLIMRDGILKRVLFAHNADRTFGVVDVRGTRISDYERDLPASIDELIFDKDTTVPPKLEEHLRSVSKKRFTKFG
jgi:hypothetical protein